MSHIINLKPNKILRRTLLAVMCAGLILSGIYAYQLFGGDVAGLSAGWWRSSRPRDSTAFCFAKSIPNI